MYLERGPILDAEIATIVMGWKGQDGLWVDPSGHTHSALRPYSTDITAVGEVIEIMLEKNFILMMRTGKNKNEGYSVTFTNPKTSEIFEEKGSTAAHTICLAALKAVGFKSPAPP